MKNQKKLIDVCGNCGEVINGNCNKCNPRKKEYKHARDYWKAHKEAKKKENELKTLKDFERVIEISKPERMKIKVIDAGIKAEAVKWVKECPHFKCDWPHLKNKPEKCSVCLMMHDFFNLTEEDLK